MKLFYLLVYKFYRLQNGAFLGLSVAPVSLLYNLHQDSRESQEMPDLEYTRPSLNSDNFD